MVRTLDRTKDIFLDTMLLGNEILIKKIKTTNKTKITVVLAAYRSVKRLQEIINNLFNQSFQDFEVIVVDDLSSSEIEEAVAAVDSSKINYIKKQLGSNSSAKNCALDFAKGEYVVFVEENSKLKQNYLEILYNEISKNNLDIAMLTRDGYPSILEEKISSGQEYLVEEIKRLKSDLNYNITSCMFKRKFLDIYNLRFQEDMLALENLYFKLKTFDIAVKVSQIGKIGYKDLLEKKSVRNNAMIDASTRRIMIVVNKIEEFKQNVKEGKSTFRGEEKFRILFEGIACWPHLRHTFTELKEAGVNVVGTVYADAFGYIYENTRELMQAYCRTPNAISFERAVDMRIKAIRETKCDGALIHINRSCKQWSGIMYEMEREIREKTGIPTAVFDGDQADPRNFSEAQYDTRVQGLIEVMSANKEGK